MIVFEHGDWERLIITRPCNITNTAYCQLVKLYISSAALVDIYVKTDLFDLVLEWDYNATTITYKTIYIRTFNTIIRLISDNIDGVTEHNMVQWMRIGMIKNQGKINVFILFFLLRIRYAEISGEYKRSGAYNEPTTEPFRASGEQKTCRGIHFIEYDWVVTLRVVDFKYIK